MNRVLQSQLTPLPSKTHASATSHDALPPPPPAGGSNEAPSGPSLESQAASAATARRETTTLDHLETSVERKRSSLRWCWWSGAAGSDDLPRGWVAPGEQGRGGPNSVGIHWACGPRGADVGATST